MASLTSRPILGSFSKGIDGSVSINFGVSGGSHCDTACKHHPGSSAVDATLACYAARAEIRPDRSQLAAKLKRHQRMSAAIICGQALFELQELQRKGKAIPWVRISTNGSLPQANQVRDDRLFRSQFRALLSWCADHDIPVHCPVETFSKARFYRALAGSLAVIRESAQTTDRFIRAIGAVSCVAGSKEQTRIQRVVAARVVAAQRREATGRKAIVCPAVLNSFASRRNPSMKNDRAKCGACTACANEFVDVVYPLH